VEAYRQQGVLAISGLDVTDAVVALAVTAFVGYFAIKLVSNFVRGRKFHYFAFYTWALGIILLIATIFLL
jgi:undecaprenyl pyrophosphate phosphatase UppP